jgi:predicted transcriptional regulator
MESQEAAGVDLFGLPVQPIRDRRGRPSFAKTKENQMFVAARAAAGWSHERIATDMGINDDTLRKHFSGELQNGRVYLEGMMIDVLTQRMREGHVPSIRMLKEIIDPHPERAAKGAGDKKPKVPALGKKEAAAAAAKQPPMGWGDLLEGEGPVQ